MVVQDFFNPEAIQENISLQDFDVAEDTLSFSDLSSNDINGSVENFSKEYQFSSSFHDQDHFFEFFSSEDFSASSTYSTDNNVIFCGKLIPYKEKTVVEAEKPPKNTSKRHIFSWRSNPKQEKCSKTLKSFPALQESTHNKGYDFSRKKASILMNSMKSRWYLFGRFPMEMELRDMKRRQSKRQQAKLIQHDDTSEKIKSGNRREKVENLWSFLRVFVCMGQQKNARVKASFGCVHNGESRY